MATSHMALCVVVVTVSRQSEQERVRQDTDTKGSNDIHRPHILLYASYRSKHSVQGSYLRNGPRGDRDS